MVPKDVGQTDLASLRLAMWTFEQDVLQDRNKFTESLRRGAPDEDLPWVEDDRFGISDHESSVPMLAAQPCCPLSSILVIINLVLQESNYYQGLSHE